MNAACLSTKLFPSSSAPLRPSPTKALPTAGLTLRIWLTVRWNTPENWVPPTRLPVPRRCGLSVSVRKGELENVERNRDKSLGITVHMGQRRGSASTSDFSQKPLNKPRRPRLTLPASRPKTRSPHCPMKKTLRCRMSSEPIWSCFPLGCHQ